MLEAQQPRRQAHAIIPHNAQQKTKPDESPGTFPQRPPLASSPGTICLFVFFYKVSRPTSPRIPEHPGLNFPRQRVHYPRLFIILPPLKVLLLLRASKPVLLECQCLWTGLKSKLPLSLPHNSPVGSPPFTLTVSKRHLQDAEAIQGRA